ncbi:hypothetical protein [Nocardia farcinica]
MIANAPESDDVSFTWELFAAQVDKDLADTRGCLTPRGVSPTQRSLGRTGRGGLCYPDRRG